MANKAGTFIPSLPRATRRIRGTWSFGATTGGGKVSKPGTGAQVTGGAIEIPGKSTVEAFFAVADLEGVVTEALIGLYITHESVGDLELRLVHPDATAIMLMDNRGGNGDNVGARSNLTVFDDTATTLVSAGAAPFLGRYKPEAPLKGFAGKLPNGTWKLRITNQQNQGGMLQGATLLVGTTSEQTVGGGGAAAGLRVGPGNPVVLG